MLVFISLFVILGLKITYATFGLATIDSCSSITGSSAGGFLEAKNAVRPLYQGVNRLAVVLTLSWVASLLWLASSYCW